MVYQHFTSFRIFTPLSLIYVITGRVLVRQKIVEKSCFTFQEYFIILTTIRNFKIY